MKISFIAVSLIVSGLMFAQTTPTSPTQGQRTGRRGNPDQAEQRFEQHLAHRLSLSAGQVNTVHTARAESRVQSQGMNQKMRTLHTSLNAAIKAGNESQIDSITQEISTVHQQQTAINAKATAKIYSALTAEQKTQVGNHLEMLGGEGGFGRGRGFGPGSNARRGGNARAGQPQ
jgi:Spy/CpxP family protein refolding chaperone